MGIKLYMNIELLEFESLIDFQIVMVRFQFFPLLLQNTYNTHASSVFILIIYIHSYRLNITLY